MSEVADPIRPVSIPQAVRDFDGPVKHIEAVVLTVRELLRTLLETLLRQESGACVLEIECTRIDAGPVREVVVLSRPSRNERHLWSLLAPKVETLNLGFGIERIVLKAIKTSRLRHEQEAFGGFASGVSGGGVSGGGHSERRFGEFIDTIIDRLGSDRAVRVDAVESHLPERAFERRSLIDGSSGRRTMVEKATGGKIESDAAAGGAAAAGDRPSIIFGRPELIDVMAMMPDGPPSWIRWRDIASAVTTSFGPERITSPWWERAPPAPPAPPLRGQGVSCPCAPTRDYFKIQDEVGQWLWVFHEVESGRWFVHGRWA